MENLNTQDINKYAPQLPEKRVYTNTMRLLILASLILGMEFVLWVEPMMQTERGLWDFAPCYMTFWAIYLAGFIGLNYKKCKEKPEAWAILGAAFLLCARWYIYEENFIGYMNLALAIPALMLLYTVYVSFDVPKGLEGQYVTIMLCAVFVKPFSAIGRFFGAIGSCFKKESSPTRRYVIVGILCALPVAVIAAALLISADEAMGYYLNSLFDNSDAWSIVRKVIAVLAIAMLSYSFIFNMSYGKKNIRTVPLEKKLPAASVIAAIAMLLIVYAVFCYFQFAYLTGLKGLPETLTYSEYAVKGFTELMVVTGINLLVYAITRCLAIETKVVRGMLTALLASTVMLLASAFMRLCLYIDVYGLTLNRILPMWFMIFLFVTVVLCAFRLYVKKLHLLRVIAAVLIVWYLLLSFLNVDALIARSVLDRADRTGIVTQADADYLRCTLSSDAHGVLVESDYASQIFYDVDPEDIK